MLKSERESFWGELGTIKERRSAHGVWWGILTSLDFQMIVVGGIDFLGLCIDSLRSLKIWS